MRPTTSRAEDAAAADDADRAEPRADNATDANALFADDTGALRAETRSLLVALLQGPFVDAQRHGSQWKTLLRDEVIVRSRLNELYLQLVLDRDAGVAFVRQIASDDADIPIVLRRQPLSFLESVLLLHLRERLTHADAQGNRAVCSEQDLLDHLQAYEGAEIGGDKTRFPKQCKAAIEKVKGARLLALLKGSDDRLEISPTLKLLFSAEQVEQLTRVYAARLAQARGGEDASGDEASPNDADADA